MRLLILDQFSDLGGAQQQLCELLPAIRERGWQALAGIPGNGELFDKVRKLGFEAERIACGPYRSGRKLASDIARFLWQAPRLAWQVRRMAERFQAELIYCNGPRLLPVLPAHIPAVFHAHSYLPPSPARRLAGAALQRTAAKVIANCEFVAGVWREYVPTERVAVIYNGISHTPAAGRAYPASACPVIACIGRIAPEKGQMEFLKVAELIHRALPEARFEIVGGALFAGGQEYERALRAAAAGLPVTFGGWVADVNDVLPYIDLLLVPSGAHEATTRVILEAYAAGVPVVAFASGGIPEIIEDGVAGYLAASADEMARRAIEILRNIVVRDRLVRAAMECWRTRFTLERYRSEVLPFLEAAAAPGTDGL